MAQHRHHHHQHRRLWYGALLLLLLLCAVRTVGARDLSQISDLKSKISGVEELLEEFRLQLQRQDQAYTATTTTTTAAAAIPATAGSSSSGGGSSGNRQGGVVVEQDSCLGGFTVAEERIIRARASIEQGATFLSVPERVYGRRDCLRACCAAEPHCTVAVVQRQEEDRPGEDGLFRCYLFNCTYRERNVCSFTPQRGFSTYSRGGAGRPAAESAAAASIFSRNTAHTHNDDAP
ncbi:hypothetical protein CRUP_005407, partial [Coryphaenoides rupestris]